MALWLVTPPTSVIIAATLFLLILLVIEGVKSFATITEFAGTEETSALFAPKRVFNRLSLISLTSDAR